jgi:ABC-2 type transport system permease protein
MTSADARSGLTFRFRPPRPRIVAALVRRDYSLTRSYKYTLALDLLFGLVNVLIYFFISRTFDGVTPAVLSAAPTYFAFAVAGIAIIVVLEAASTGLADRIRQEQLTGTLEALVAQPVTSTEMSLGMAGFGFFFALTRAAFYLLFAVAFLGLESARISWMGFVAVLAAAGAAFSAIGIVLAAVVLVLKRGHVIAGVVTFGMGLLSGAFFPISVLPGWLQPVGKVLPTRFAFDGVRQAMFRGSGWGDDLVVLLGFSAFALPIAVSIFAGSLLLSRRAGSLGQY